MPRTEYQRQWYLKNREKKLEQSRARYLANRELRLQQTKEYHKLHPEVAKKAWRKHQSVHQDTCLKHNREWYHRNADSQRIRGRTKGKKYYLENKEHVLALSKKWRDANPDNIRNRDMRRRALVRGAKVNLSNIREWIKSIKSKPFIKCYYCDNSVSTHRIHFDHIVALKNGGSHSVENLCVSCAPCNLSKKDKMVTAWVRVGQQTLEL